ncbi:MAG: acyltransferase family protein, partial [Rhizobiaceae bacterium]|nr:acyltransferase family protein [Rhizobiaceae bacterium]
AVEEQFYVVFPPLMVVLYRFLGKRWIWPLAAILVASLAWSELVVQNAQPDAFYLPHLRAWELMLGALLALGVLPEATNRPLREMVGIAGLAMIAWSVFTYTDDTVFPGLSALLPCLGTAGIIYAGRSGDYLVGRLLGIAPMVWVGLISYSLYLWHWPILQLAEYYNIVPLDDWQAGAAVTASFAAAALSYWIVERPFRRTTRPRSFIFASGAAMTASAIAFGLVVFLTAGLPVRFSPDSLRYANMMAKELYYPIYDRGRCFLDYNQGVDDYDLEACATPTDGRRILIWGDSYAANLYPGLKAQADATVYQYTATSCRPIIQGQRRCDPIYDGFPEVAARISPDLVIIAGSWVSRIRRDDDFKDRLRDSIRIAKATGASVIVAGQSPTYGFQLPRLAFMFPKVRTEPVVKYPARDWSSFNEVVAAVAASEGVPFHDFYRECEGLTCTAFLDGEPLHWDGGHMTMVGSLFYTEGLLADPAVAAIKAGTGTYSSHYRPGGS